MLMKLDRDCRKTYALRTAGVQMKRLHIVQTNAAARLVPGFDASATHTNSTLH